jgi:hypothetical protein
LALVALAPATAEWAEPQTTVPQRFCTSVRAPMSRTVPQPSDQPGERFTTADVVAGFMAAGSLALSFIAAGFGLILGVQAHPGRLAPIAAVLALVAARMSDRFQRLAYYAVIGAMIGWTLGMTLAVITNNSVF